MPPASPTPPPPPTLNWLIFRGINLTCLCLRAVVFLSPSPSLWGASSVGVVVVVGGEGNGWQWQRGREGGEKKKRGEGGKDGLTGGGEGGRGEQRVEGGSDRGDLTDRKQEGMVVVVVVGVYLRHPLVIIYVDAFWSFAVVFPPPPGNAACTPAH